MSRDIERWSASSEAPAELMQLLATAKQDLPNAAQLASLEGKLASLLDAPVSPPSSLPDAVAPTSSSMPALAKLAVLVAVGGLVGTGAWLNAKHRQSVAIETPSAGTTQAPPLPLKPKPSALDSGSGMPSAVVEPELAKPAEPMPRATPRAHDAKTVPAKPSEASLLSQAQRALKSSPERALALTKRHKQLYPNGSLAQEREVIAIEALARLDKKGTAAQKASEFGDKYPDSAHQKKVDSALEK